MSSIINFLDSYDPNKITKPYLIAEAGVNHEGSIEIAKRLIDEALEGGADAIKFQTYKASTLAAKNSPAYWDTSKEPTKSQFELFSKHDKFWKKEFEELKVHCDKAGIEFLSTPFDKESAAFLNELMPVFKISSSDITNFPFIEIQCQYKKPILLSTGASDLMEVQEAVDLVRSKGNKLCLLHCVLNYPTSNEKANLGMIWAIKRHFPDLIHGYSDHTLPGNMDVLITATLLGAAVLEKHFTHDKKLPGNDHYHAMDKEDIKLFLKRWNETQELLGSFELNALAEEESARVNARRSLVAANSIKKGDVIEGNDLTWKRPATGISPRYNDEVIGRTALIDIEKDAILEWEMISGDKL